MSTTYQCSSCGREIEPAPHCPHCGTEQLRWADDVARIERSIAEMKIREAALAREQKTIASQMQAALFQRDILSHAADQRRKQNTKPRRVIRRKANRRPPTAAPGTAPGGPPPRVPRQPRSGPDRTTPTTPPPPPPPPPAGAEPSWDDGGKARPEASTREVQNILLGLGALLLGIAAVVFVAVALSSLDDFSRVAILVLATALMLAVPPRVAQRGLSATAETIAAVGLLLVPLTGYSLWTVDRFGDSGLPGSLFAGLTFLLTAAVAAGYASVTGLNAPRYAAVLAVQPILPLLAYSFVTGPAGWAVVLAAVAVGNLYLGRLFGDDGRLTGWPARFRFGPEVPVTAPPGTPRVRPDERPGRVDGDPTAPDGIGPDRPETFPEEADAVVQADPALGGPTKRVRTPGVRSTTRTPWVRELAWALHGLAFAVAVVCAVIALVNADTVPGASRAGLALLLAAGVGMVGALVLRRPPLPDIGAGILTLAVIGAAGRVAAVALPGRALVVIAAVIALTGLGVRAVPEAARRGPQLASAAALIVIGIVVAGGALRAALAPIRAALPVWEADLSEYPGKLAAGVGDTSWQLAVTALLLTIAAVLSSPPEVRREFAVVGAALTALAMPASFGLGWVAAPWPPVLVAVAIGVVGLTAETRRAALTHAVAAAVVGLAGAAASVARPGLTAAVLFALAVGGALVALAPLARTTPAGRWSGLVGDWAAGGAAFAFPGAVAAFVASAVPVDPTPTALSVREATEPVLAASFLAVCAVLCYAAVTQVAQRQISVPLALGTGLGALAVTAAAFGAPGATLPDTLVGGLLLVSAVLLVLAPSIDSGRRADRLLDGSDIAAAAVTAALVGTLARIAGILGDGAELAAAAFLILVVAAGIRAMPVEWRRGPVLGIALTGGIVALLAGWTALSGGLQVLATPGRLWAADLAQWHVSETGTGWQAPVALLLLAGAAAIALPRPWAYDVAAVCVGLATIGTPAAFGLPWWSPIVVGGAVATVYGVSSVVASDPRAGLARATVAGVVALHAVGASLVRPWTTAAALGIVALIGAVVAILARVVGTLSGPADEADTWSMPPQTAQIGGLAAGGALFALSGALASLAAALHRPAEVVVLATLAGASLGVAVTGLVRRQVPQYLPYATMGIVGGATATSVAALFTGLPWGVYAAAAVLLGVLAELIRAVTPAPTPLREPIRRWSVMLGGALRRLPEPARGGRWSVSPAVGAMLAAALPTALAVAALAPALVVALVEPYQTLTQIWDGVPAALVDPEPGAVDPGNVLAALLLTIAAGLAATGFSGGRPARAVPVVLPGAAITLLITPISLDLAWPNGTLAALAVFTIAMLGLALTPPPPDAEVARSLRLTRILVFGIGLAAGGAGLAGALASRELTLFTLGAAVGVGAVAALGGRTQNARILGWLFASVMAQTFVFTLGLVLGLDPAWSAFGVLAVGAVLLLVAAMLPRLRRPEAIREATTVEWSGYAAALIAAALAYDSPRHIAALLAAWGAVLGMAAVRPYRRTAERRTLFWSAVGCEVVAWWMLMALADVALPEAYTLAFAVLALLVGLLEMRHRADLSSWVAYGPALVAAFLPTLVIVLAGNDSAIRQVLLLLGGVATLIWGSNRRQQAPVIIGAVVTALAALRALFSFGPWLVLIPVGLLLLAFGASNENRRRTQERFRAVRGMR
ncbi:zinc ribbon domain-containing protein [Plantactinospora sp. BB1]|uniref:FmdB family zinc ribbon protein n=1 Tax=Plantactinospora sp. BB1 TaxID=2071627 RepID=UPI000D15B15E|nr:zinc ribbon domain-containing protein [Plantactinospora sp. BB1]AVT38901.1 permease [Plantactinospora sp. BB1]